MFRLTQYLGGCTFGVAVVAMLFLSLGCMSQKPTGSQADISPSESSESAPIFPHADGWENPASHGVWVVQSGAHEPCLVCHKLISTEEEETPTCSSCHPLYPHVSDWIQKESHGSEVLSGGQNTCATQCHGYDLQGGLSGIACNFCHTVYPHDSTWSDPEEHGGIAKGDGKILCQSCHGDDFSTVLDGQNCFSCHANYPHLPGWKTDLGVPQEHGVAAYGAGKDSCATANCHGVNFEGSANAISCKDAACHEDFPHNVVNWVNGYASTHVPRFVERVQTPGDSACAECHGSPDYDRDMGGSACTDCHSPVTHKANWDQGTEHGVYYSTTLGYTSSDAGSGSANCTNCHGTAVAFTDSFVNALGSCGNCHAYFHGATIDLAVLDAMKAALAVQSACYSCHWAYPHISYEYDHTGPVGTNSTTWGPPPDPVPSQTIHSGEPMYGHQYYTMRSKLFTDADGNRPGMLPTVPATENSCGGSTANNCHSDGYRSVSDRGSACGSYCHTTTP